MTSSVQALLVCRWYHGLWDRGPAGGQTGWPPDAGWVPPRQRIHPTRGPRAARLPEHHGHQPPLRVGLVAPDLHDDPPQPEGTYQSPCKCECGLHSSSGVGKIGCLSFSCKTAYSSLRILQIFPDRTMYRLRAAQKEIRSVAYSLIQVSVKATSSPPA